jgi:hypothetical protein
MEQWKKLSKWFSMLVKLGCDRRLLLGQGVWKIGFMWSHVANLPQAVVLSTCSSRCEFHANLLG